MTIGEETTIYVQLQIDVYGGCIELMSRDVPEAEARRMFSKVVADPRPVKEDIAALLATETRGDTLLLGYSAPGLRGRHGTVEFALEHAIDAAEKYLGFPADELRATLRLANVSALIDERERGMATLQAEFPELAELYEAFVDAVDDLREDPPHEVTRDIALTCGALH